MTTNYRKAWLAFRETDDYQNACNEMFRKNMKQPYIDNILEVSFAAGWGDKKIVRVEEKMQAK